MIDAVSDQSSFDQSTFLAHWPIVDQFGTLTEYKSPTYSMRHGPGPVAQAFKKAGIERVDFTPVIMARALILNAIKSGQLREEDFDAAIKNLAPAIETLQPILQSLYPGIDNNRSSYYEPESNGVFAPIHAFHILNAIKRMHAHDPSKLAQLRCYVK